MTVSVLNTPKWTPRQALLEALTQCDDWESVAIVGKSPEGYYPSIIGGELGTERLYFCGQVLQRRAIRDGTYDE